MIFVNYYGFVCISNIFLIGENTYIFTRNIPANLRTVGITENVNFDKNVWIDDNEEKLTKQNSYSNLVIY